MSKIMNEGYSLLLNAACIDKTIKSELGLLGIVSSLCAKEGYCWATNEYLSEMFEVSPDTISRKINKLIKKNYLMVEYNTRGTAISERILRLNLSVVDDRRKTRSPLTKSAITIDEKRDHNIISINNINKNISNVGNKNEIDFDKLLLYLNKQTKREFKIINKSVRAKFNARLREGYTKEDIVLAIRNASLSKHHLESNCKYLTPDFFTRTNTLDMYGFNKKQKTEKEIVKDGGHRNF